MTRTWIFLKVANFRCTGGFWGDESRGTKIFSIRVFLTLTGPLVKIGGQRLILKSYQLHQHVLPILNLSVPPF